MIALLLRPSPGLEERVLSPKRFEAWANGPVCPELYQLHCGRFEFTRDDVPGDPDALDDGERESVDLVLGAMAA